MNQPIITVFGATGAQGGGLARAILDDPRQRFALRAVTRKPDSPAAQTLAAAGAEIVLADLDDACSLSRALEGSHGAFFLTNFWEHLSGTREIAQAHNLAAAAAQANIRHAIWSTLEDTRTFFPVDGQRMPVLQGQFNVPHFDAKAEANRLFRQFQIPTTFLYTSCYWENMIYFGLGPQRDSDGVLRVRYPIGETPMPWIGVEDIGRAAFQIFLRGERCVGESIGIAGEHLTGTEQAALLTEALGETVEFQSLTPAAYRALGFAGADELGNMFQFKRDFNADYCALRDVARSRDLVPEMQDFRQWLAQHSQRIPLH